MVVFGTIRKRAAQDDGFVPVVAAEQSSGVSQPPPTPVDHTNSQDSLRASALPDGQRALTPIIAGTISGTCIAIAWLVALVVAIVKRHKRKKRALMRKANLLDIKHKIDKGKGKGKEIKEGEAVIIPPDPAVVMGISKPGEYILGSKKGKGKWKSKGKGREGLPFPMTCNTGAGASDLIPPSASRSEPAQSESSVFLTPTWTRDRDGGGVSTGQHSLAEGTGSIRTYGSKSALTRVREEEYAYHSVPPSTRQTDDSSENSSNSSSSSGESVGQVLDQQGRAPHMREFGGSGDINEPIIVQSPIELEDFTDSRLRRSTS